MFSLPTLLPRLGLLLLVLVGLLGETRAAHAYPSMLKHGYEGCANCHVDPSGGELLTELGRSQGSLLLAMSYGSERGSAPSEPLWGVLHTPRWLEVGGSYRHLTIAKLGEDKSLASFPMQADLYGALAISRFRAGGSLGISRVPAGSPHARAAHITRGDDGGLNLLSRTHWLGVSLSERTLLRAGRLNLPFGLRIPEHVLWVRDGTRTDRESDQQHGLSLAFSARRLRGEVMAILGNYQVRPDRFRERGYAGFAELMLSKKFALGWSSLATLAESDLTTLRDERTARVVDGIFVRAVLARPLVLLAEADVLGSSVRGLGYAGLAQLDLEVVQGFHVLATGEVLDVGRDERGNSPARPGAGQAQPGAWLSLDYHFLPQLSARIDAIQRDETPFTLMSQLHLYL